MVDETPATLGDAEEEQYEPSQQRGPAQRPMKYASVYEFYEGMVHPILRERLIRSQHQRWSAYWWKSTEAMLRLDAVWRAYEKLKDDPGTGMSVWFRDHFDPHMQVLTSDAGPFGESRDSSKRGEYPAYEPPPQEVLEAKKRLAL